METVAMHQHLTAKQASGVRPKAGDDALRWKWLTITPESLATLSGSHGELVRRAVARLER